MRFLASLAACLVTTAAAADPSTTSIEIGTMGDLQARFIVAPSTELQVADRTWRYWVVMPNTAASELRIELSTISFAGDDAPIECTVADCFGVFRTLRIDPSETLFVTSNREILSLTLVASDESGRTALPTMLGLFVGCSETRPLMEAIFSDWRSHFSRTSVSYAPFPAVLDIGLSPVCVY